MYKLARLNIKYLHFGDVVMSTLFLNISDL